MTADSKPIPSYAKCDFEIANLDIDDARMLATNAYFVHMHHLDPFGVLVFADDDQEAIDTVADYGDAMGYAGWFIDQDEVGDHAENEVIRVGNKVLPVDSTELHVRRLSKKQKEFAHALVRCMRALHGLNLSDEETGVLQQGLQVLRAKVWGSVNAR